MVSGASWVLFKQRKTKIGQKTSLTPFFHRDLQIAFANCRQVYLCVNINWNNKTVVVVVVVSMFKHVLQVEMPLICLQIFGRLLLH